MHILHLTVLSCLYLIDVSLSIYLVMFHSICWNEMPVFQLRGSLLTMVISPNRPMKEK